MEPPRSDSNVVTVTPTDGQPTAVRYRDVGQGPPVVLLHGIGMDAADISWKYAIPQLATNHRVIAPDLPGHGESDRPDVRYTTEYYIDVLESLLAELDLGRVSLTGISMGGGVALGYALEHELDRLALVDSYGLAPTAPWLPMAAMGLSVPGANQLLWQTMGTNRTTVRETLRGYMTQASEELVDEIHTVLQDGDHGRTLRSWQRSEFLTTGFKTCYRNVLTELDVPTLLVHGENDTLFPWSWSRHAAELIPESDLRVFENCGHWPPREHPTRFNSVLAEFLAS